MDSIAFKSELMTDWYEEDIDNSYHDTNHRIHTANRTSEAFILPLTGKYFTSQMSNIESK